MKFSGTCTQRSTSLFTALQAEGRNTTLSLQSVTSQELHARHFVLVRERRGGGGDRALVCMTLRRKEWGVLGCAGVGNDGIMIIRGGRYVSAIERFFLDVLLGGR